ncbi:MAG: hypothetical protein GXO96_03020 [Nitrospirae bacterium]|nr:hypothetical protein [Candidatus Manganitrophaceae bacterium]
MKWIIFIIFISVGFPNFTRADENLQIFIDQLLNSKALDSYWHIDTFPERIPVVVSLPSNISLVEKQIKKFGQTVVFTHESQKYENVFSIQIFNIKNDTATLEFTYSPEGIRGLAVYEKKGEIWKLVSVEVNES